MQILCDKHRVDRNLKKLDVVTQCPTKKLQVTFLFVLGYLGLVHQEDKTIINAHIGTPKSIKQILTDLKGEINSNNTRRLSTIDRSFRQKISNEVVDLTAL